MKIKLIGKWNDEVGGTRNRYCELRLGTAEACYVINRESGLTYVMECYNGDDVYPYMVGADFPLRKLTRDEEKEVIAYAERVFLNGVKYGRGD